MGWEVGRLVKIDVGGLVFKNGISERQGQVLTQKRVSLSQIEQVFRKIEERAAEVLKFREEVDGFNGSFDGPTSGQLTGVPTEIGKEVFAERGEGD